MPITDKHRDVESRFRKLLTDATLPTPDDVGYEPESIVFYWHGPRVAVCVDFDQGPLDALAACRSHRQRLAAEARYVRSAASSSAGGSTEAAESVTSMPASRP